VAERKGVGVFRREHLRKGHCCGSLQESLRFRNDDEIRNAFADRIGDKIERVPINDIDLRYEDGAITSLIRRALVRAMAARAGVKTDDRDFLWEKTARERRKEGEKEYLVYDAVVVYLPKSRWKELCCAQADRPD